MKRLFGLVVVLTLAWGAAPSGADDELLKSTDWYPLAEGNRWIYEMKGQAKPLLIAISGRQKIAEVETYRLDASLDGKILTSEFLSQGPDGIKRHRVDDRLIEPAAYLCQYPLKTESKWEAKYKQGDQVVSVQATSEMVAVTVPFGKFKANKIISRIEEGGTTMTATVWLVDKIGPVKQTIQRGTETVTLELIKFEKAGKK